MSINSKKPIAKYLKFKISGFFLCVAIIFFFQGCIKENILSVTIGSSEVTGNSVMLTGTVLNLNKNKPFKKGFCYNTSGNPTIDDDSVIDPNPGSTISAGLTDLKDMQQYYFKAFVEQNGELSYGEIQSFTTGKSWLNNDLSYETISDIDGNSYPVITINNRKWMAENLRTTRFSNGDLITNVNSDMQWIQTTSPAWCYPNNNASKNIPNGKFYNGYTATDNRNVCPTGWHVPTYIEWVNMLTFIDPNVINNPMENTAGGELKSIGNRFWTPPNTGAGNQTGFSATGADLRQDSSAFNQFGYGAYWWTSDLSGLVGQWHIELSTYNARANVDIFSPTMGLSVRCIQNQ